MPAVFSTEGKIETHLRELQTSARNFVKIAKLCGITISDATLSNCLSDKSRLDFYVGEKLLRLLGEMRELQTLSSAPVDWSQADEVSRQLVARREIQSVISDDEELMYKFLVVGNVRAS